MDYAEPGRRDEAMEMLEKAYAEKEAGMIFLPVEPNLDPIRDDPRFQALLRRMNFPE